MKITIDTKEDSTEEIKRIIGFLSNLVGSSEVITNQGNIFEDPKPAEESGSSNAFLNMFGSSSSSTPSAGSSESSGYSVPAATEEKKDRPPQIVEWL